MAYLFVNWWLKASGCLMAYLNRSFIEILKAEFIFFSNVILWIEWIICHPLQIPWDYRYIKGTKSNGWHIDLVAKKTGILVEKLSKAAKNQPQSANCKTSVQKLSKYVKSCQKLIAMSCPCPVHILSLVHCIFWLKTQPRGQIFKPMGNLVCLGFDQSQFLF